MYEIRYSDGAVTQHAAYVDALVCFADRYPDGVTKHAGDLTEGGDRTLLWADPESALNDDGAKAVASIRRV